MWTMCLCQPHHHSWLRTLSVMEGKWSDGWLAAPSQMAAGTALRLAGNQRTSKLRRTLKPISVQSQEAKGTEQKKKTAIE
ncbi:Aspartate ammonia-lyase [Dissostichus eleginoides]|uniref:Aspartate ammonia-lyase n=1 Tax=Dissostichus eleginoides TaxID=100907 RepID=A0AAD9BNW0_DISEL|nr:Aspartate ammonia-lyase [Dissostichus eleginoides]